MRPGSRTSMQEPARPPRKRLLRAAQVVGLLMALAASLVLVDAWFALGKAPDGERRARMEASPQWIGSGFENAIPMWNDIPGMMMSWREMSPHAEADFDFPVVKHDKSHLAQPPVSGLRVTWLGHSTVLIEMDGLRFLTDPIFGGRAAPLDWIGPKTWYPPPIPLDELENIDAVLISHDHYDHLQTETIVALKDRDSKFVVPLGVGAHLEYWGVAADKIVELDWWDRAHIGAVELVMTPARHASGRQVFDQRRTLWASYALLGSTHRAYFGGDTGLFDELADIGKALGPFDVTMFEVGAYSRYWPDWHLGPENAVRAHELVRGDLLLPIHWGLLNLAPHGWTEPAERVLLEARRRGVRALLPKPGEPFEPGAAPSTRKWWPQLPWQTVAEHSVDPTGLKPETLRVP